MNDSAPLRSGSEADGLLSPFAIAPADTPTVVHLLATRARRNPARPALTVLAPGGEPSCRLDYGTLDSAVASSAASIARDIRSGDRVLLLFENTAAFAVAFLGCLRAGGIAVPAPRWAHRDRMAGIMADCRPALVLVEHDEAADGRWDSLELSDAIEGTVWRTLPPIPDTNPPKANDAITACTWPTPDMPAMLQYTSGSISDPRGVVVSHANIMANARILAEAMDVTEQSVVVSWLPVFHDMGLFGGLLQALCCGGHTILLPRLTVLRNPLNWLRAISDHRATISGAPNFAYEACVEALARREAPALDLSSWRLAYNGAEPVQARTLERFARAFAPYGFRSESCYPTYGMAEATLFLTGSRPGRLPVVRSFDGAITGATGTVDLVSSGRPVPGTTLRIVDPATRTVLPDVSVGEVWASGPQIAGSYWQDEPASATLRAILPDQPGIPFLRTGDLGFLDDGELFVTGRLGDVITWHGRNIYPQDLEHLACAAHPAIEPGCAAAFALDDSPARVSIVIGLRKGKSAWDFSAVVDAVREAIWYAADVVLDTVALVPRADIARTSSGKIRRKVMRRALREGALSLLHMDRAEPGVVAAKRRATHDAASGGGAREGGRADRLAALAHLPDRPLPIVLDPDLPLFAQGYDSLSLLTLAGRIEDHFGTAPSTELLFAATAGAIDDWLAGLPPRTEHRSRASRRPGTRRLTRLPLSREQLAVYFADSGAGASVALLPLVLPAVDEQRLAAVVAGLLQRHPMLNARLANGPDGAAFDLATPEDTPSDSLIEKLPDVEGEDAYALERRLWRAARAPIDMRRRAPLRLIVGPALGPALPTVLAVHHLVCDARSLARIADELSAEFAGAAPDLTLGPPIGVMAGEEARLSTAARDRDLRAWKDDLSGVPPSVSPPWPAPDTADDADAMPVRRFLLESALVDAIRETGTALGVSTATVLLSAWWVTLSRLGVPSPAAITITAVARESLRNDAGIGYAVRPVPIRMRSADEDGSLRSLILATHERIAAALDREAAPFPLVVHALQIPRRDRYAPFMRFQFGHVRLRNPVAVDARGACAALEREHAAAGPYSFLLPQMEAIAQANLQIYETDRDVAGMLVYDPLTVRADTADSLESTFRQVVTAMIADIDSPPDAIDLVTPDGTAAAAVTPWRVDFLPVHELARRRSATASSRWAVIEPSGGTDHRALWRQVDRLAALLPVRGDRPGSIVATVLPRSADLVAAQLAILQAGHAFLPIDPTAPAGRVAEILDDARPAIVLVTTRTVSRVPAGCTVLAIDAPDAGHGYTTTAPPTVADDDPAFVIYTSGSTGRPKGVVCSHGALASRIADLTALMEVQPESRVLAYVSPAFDPAVQEVFMAVTRGAVLVVAPQADGFDPREIATIMAREGVTHAVAVPSMLREIVTQPEFAGCRSLRCVSCGGETLSAELRDRLVRVSGARLLNVYGATETTICGTVWDATDRPDRLVAAVGHAMADTVVRIVDDTIRPLPAGVIGEIAVGGPALGSGYLNRPIETAARFVADPVAGSDARLYRTGDAGWLDGSGLLWFVGRLDDQVKISGYRIEPEEVAARLRAHPGVEDATVLAVSTADGETLELIAYVCRQTEQPPTIRALAAGLAGSLPAPLCPTAYVMLDRMPLTVNGKIDRSALPPPTAADRTAAHRGDAPSQRAPVGGDPLIGAIGKLGAEVLGVAQIDPDADFFAIGGHSLLALQLVHRLEAEFGYRVPATALYTHASVNALAALLRSASDGRGTPGADTAERGPLCRTLRHDGRRDPLFLAAPGLRGLAAFDRLLPHLAPDRPVFCLSPPEPGAEPAISCMADLVHCYAEAVTQASGGRAVHLAGYSVGGIAAYATAQAVVAGGGTVASLTLIDTLGPRWTRVGLAAVATMNRFPGLFARLSLLTGDRRFVELAGDTPLLNHLRLAVGHRPGVWPAVLNFVGRTAGARMLDLLIDQWVASSAALNRIAVPGDHSSMFLEPAVDTLAATLDGIMSMSESSASEGDEPIPGDTR